jgi:hypothetical protein
MSNINKGALSIDIETLERLHIVPLPPITCICMYNECTNTKFKLRFWNAPQVEYDKNKKLVLSELDNATCIIGYNVVLFDLEFIKRTFSDDVDDHRMSQWVLKTIDPFMFLKYISKCTCKLDALLKLNKLDSKSGSGGNAIILAQEGKWEELLDYCMDNTMLTFQLFSRVKISCGTKSEIQISPVLKLEWNYVLNNSNNGSLAASEKKPRFVSVCYGQIEENCDQEDYKKEDDVTTVILSEIGLPLCTIGDIIYEI